MNDYWYYDFCNLDHFLNRQLIKDNKSLIPFRYVNDLLNVKISQFTYKNLPEGLTSQILETALLFANQLCFWYSAALGKWVLCRYRYGSEFNEYWKPKFVTIQTISGNMTLADMVPYEEIVLVKDNEMDIPPFLTLMEYINIINKLEKDMFKMTTLGTLPVVLSGNKKQAAALKQTAKALGSEAPFIVGDDTVSDQLRSFDIDLPIKPMELYDVRKKYINEARASMGIYSVDEKRERIVTQELLNLNDFSDTVYQIMVNCRKRMCEEGKKMGAKIGHPFDIELVETYNEVFDVSVEEAEKLAKANEAGKEQSDKKEEKKDD